MLLNIILRAKHLLGIIPIRWQVQGSPVPLTAVASTFLYVPWVAKGCMYYALNIEIRGGALLWLVEIR